MMIRNLALPLLALSLVTAAHAGPRLATRCDATAVPAHFLDINNLAGGSQGNSLLGASWGMAANESLRILYTNTGATLQKWNYDTWTSAGANVTLQANMVSLAFSQASGKLYGTRNISSTGFPEGLYEINPDTGVCTLVNAYAAGYDLGGLDFDPVSGKLYAANDGTSPARGIYEFDPTFATLTLVGNYPTGRSDIDGLAAYSGNIYLCEDGGTASDRIWVYNISSNSFTADYPVPWTNSGTFSGAAVFDFSAPVATLTGTVSLESYNPGPVGVEVDFEILDSGSNVVDTETLLLGTGGSFSFTTTVAPGNYTIKAKASHWLKKGAAITVTASGASGIALTLRNGDVTDDNEVGAADFSVLAAAYDSVQGDPNFAAAADLNGDEEVGAADFSILAASYDESGD